MLDRDDETLRARFDELRSDVQSTVPPFRSQWERASADARVATRPMRWTPIWIAAAIVVFAAGAIVVQRHGADRTREFAWPTITSWTSPTAGLLDTPGADLLAPPSILSSSPDGGFTAAVTHHGVSR